MLEQLHVRTPRRDALVDVTDRVRAAVAQSGVKEGVCHVVVPHTTAGITLNEGADPNLPNDLLRYLDEAVPWQNRWTHIEPNAAAHVKAALMGSSTTLIVHDGALVLGTWQAIFFCEFDGPRDRSLLVKIVAG